MPRSLASWLLARHWPLLAATLTIALGLASRAFLHGPPAKITGVALYATLIYCLVRAAQPRPTPSPPSSITPATSPPHAAEHRQSPFRASMWALAISWGVEFLQLTPLPSTLSAMHPVLRLVFGEVFSPIDLIWYAIGVALGLAIELGARAAIRRQ